MSNRYCIYVCNSKWSTCIFQQIQLIVRDPSVYIQKGLHVCLTVGAAVYTELFLDNNSCIPSSSNQHLTYADVQKVNWD